MMQFHSYTDDQGHHDQDTLVATVRGLQAEKRRLQDEVRMLKGDLAAQAKKVGIKNNPTQHHTLFPPCSLHL